MNLNKCNDNNNRGVNNNRNHEDDPVLLSINANLLKPPADDMFKPPPPPRVTPHITYDPASGVFAQSTAPYPRPFIPNYQQQNLAAKQPPPQQPPQPQQPQQPHNNRGHPAHNNYNPAPNSNNYPTFGGGKYYQPPHQNQLFSTSNKRRPQLVGQDPDEEQQRRFPSLGGDRNKRGYPRRINNGMAAPGAHCVSDTQSVNALFAERNSKAESLAPAASRPVTSSLKPQKACSESILTEGGGGGSGVGPPVVTLSIKSMSSTSGKSARTRNSQHQQQQNHQHDSRSSIVSLPQSSLGGGKSAVTTGAKQRIHLCDFN